MEPTRVGACSRAAHSSPLCSQPEQSRRRVEIVGSAWYRAIHGCGDRVPRNDGAELPHRPGRPRRNRCRASERDANLVGESARTVSLGGFRDRGARSRRRRSRVGGKRLALIADCDLLQITDAVERLAALLLGRGLVPDTVPNDALHIAVSTVGGAEYLLTWNLRHLAGAPARRRIEQELRRLGYEPPTICTPEELMP